ncbi:MAG TPA: Hsp20/alpha crystallin family protein [Coriobacteriia bacterium]|jgi:HSP20 family protein
MATSADPFADLLTLQRDMDRIMTRFGAPPRMAGEDGRSFWMPAVDVFKQGADMVVRVELPGVGAADINVSVTGNMLSVKGERRRDESRSEDDYVMRESTYGAFERRITMPEDIDASQVRAQYRAGVLEVMVPGSALIAPQPHPVPVASARQPQPAVGGGQAAPQSGYQQPGVQVQGGWVAPQQPQQGQEPHASAPSQQQMGTSYAAQQGQQPEEPPEEQKRRTRLGGWLHGDEG